MIWWVSAAGALALLWLMMSRPGGQVTAAPRARARLPHQVLSPARLPGVRGQSLWRLRPDPHCAHTRGRIGEHALASEAPDLAELGCDVDHCRCTWRPTPDRRKGDRRRVGGVVSAERRSGDRRRG